MVNEPPRPVYLTPSDRRFWFDSSVPSLISANSDAFESYGLSASLNAPTCANCGEAFTRGINSLLAGVSRFTV